VSTVNSLTTSLATLLATLREASCLQSAALIDCISNSRAEEAERARCIIV
jgi:hypothetical protein